MFTRRAAVLCVPALLFLASCSEPPKKAKEPEKPAEPVGAQYAFHQVFLTARTWAPDAMGMQMRDIPVSGVKPEGGKRGAWEVTLVSPGKGKARSFTYSVVEEGNIHQGVFAGLEEDYRGPRGQAVAWPIQAFRTDSEEAYKVAVEKSADFIKKNPDVPVIFLLEQTSRHPQLAWRVLWGTSVGSSAHSVYVGASNGEFLERMH